MSLVYRFRFADSLFAFAAAVVSSRVRGNSSWLHTKARGQAQEELRGHVREISSGAFRLLLATCDLRPATWLIEHRITSFNVGEGDTFKYRFAIKHGTASICELYLSSG